VTGGGDEPAADEGFSDAPAATPVAPCEGALSPEEAQALFDDMAAQADIPFDFPPDCCYARAERMSQLMTGRGIENRKAWAYASRPFGTLDPTNADGSLVRFPPGSGDPVQWGYHVAPTVLVRQPDGTCRDMVIDPSLRDTPVTVDEWEGLMGGASTSASTPNDIFYRNDTGTREIRRSDLTDAERIEEPFAKHRAARDSELRP
ncbi:MAG: protein-glutamine glutaminase family protein, partial [Paracoccaceae bacterium]